MRMAVIQVNFAYIDKLLCEGNALTWRWKTGLGEAMTSVFPEEWAEWDQERKDAFYSEMHSYSAVAEVCRHAPQSV
jgi:hypothetical protein